MENIAFDACSKAYKSLLQNSRYWSVQTQNNTNKVYRQRDLRGNHHLTNGNIISNIMQYIKSMPVDTYNVGQKSFDQNFNY